MEGPVLICLHYPFHSSSNQQNTLFHTSALPATADKRKAISCSFLQTSLLFPCTVLFSPVTNMFQDGRFPSEMGNKVPRRKECIYCRFLIVGSSRNPHGYNLVVNLYCNTESRLFQHSSPSIIALVYMLFYIRLHGCEERHDKRMLNLKFFLTCNEVQA